jgi:hypothetical protein
MDNNIIRTKKQRERELRKKYRNKKKTNKKYKEEQAYDTEKLPKSIPSEIQETPKSLPLEINKGKSFIMPKTQIIDYIFSNYQKYNYIKRQRENNREYPVTFDEIFLFDINSIPNKLNVNLNTQILQNPEFSLDKLISYSIYTT